VVVVVGRVVVVGIVVVEDVEDTVVGEDVVVVGVVVVVDVCVVVVDVEVLADVEVEAGVLANVDVDIVADVVLVGEEDMDELELVDDDDIVEVVIGLVGPGGVVEKFGGARVVPQSFNKVIEIFCAKIFKAFVSVISRRTYEYPGPDDKLAKFETPPFPTPIVIILDPCDLRSEI
jgi:hypothetical protein